MVEEIIEYIDEEDEALLDGKKTIEQVLVQHNARTIADFHKARSNLVANGQPAFQAYQLRDLLAYLYEDNILLTEFDDTENNLYDDDEDDHDEEVDDDDDTYIDEESEEEEV